MSDHQITQVLFYGKLADSFGSRLKLTVPSGCSIAQLRDHIAANCPEAAEMLGSRKIRACIADTLVPDEHILAPGEQVEFFPPVSGG